jgi:Cd2+/Zn2+-exporting ATPase
MVSFVVSIVSGGWEVAGKGLRAVLRLRFTMHFLMTVAVIGALAIGRWEEGAAVVFLFALAELLERSSMDRARNAIRSLLKLSPTIARVLRDESGEVDVPVESVLIGERIVIRPGSRIPLDGIVVAGSSGVDQSAITGESIPVPKREHDEVFAGTMNGQGTLDVQVTRQHYDTTLARIVRTVQEAQSERAPMQQLTDRFASVYTPSVLAVAALLATIPPIFFDGIFAEWFYRALVLLVIACPCALVISTPVTIVSALSHAARRGVLIKGGRYVEELERVRAIVFDKTGTLTKGVPRVTDIVPLNSISPEEILRITAAVESRSEHHLAAAILQKAAELSVGRDETGVQHHFEALAGRGVTARIDGVTYFVGSHALMEERNVCSERVEEVLHGLERDGKTTLVLASDREALGVIAIADELRPDADLVVRDLLAGGIKKVVLLSGDNPTTAQSIATRAGIENVHAGVLPEEKAHYVRRLKAQYGSVAMVGDGINDAPALAASSVGIAMGNTGTDVALETADVVLTSDELAKIPFLRALSKRTLRIIRQNIAIALVVKGFFLALGALGVATLWMAVLADDGATLIVILNGLRVLRFRA